MANNELDETTDSTSKAKVGTWVLWLGWLCIVVAAVASWQASLSFGDPAAGDSVRKVGMSITTYCGIGGCSMGLVLLFCKRWLAGILLMIASFIVPVIGLTAGLVPRLLDTFK